MKFIDIGLNLAHDSFDHDRDAVMEAARRAGVAACIITGTDLPGSRTALAMAGQDAYWFSTAGIHPHHAGEFSGDELPALETLLASNKVVAIGECGLDFFRDFSPRDRQREVLDMQLELAGRIAKPLFLHQRGAHQALREQLDAQPDATRHGAVVHCFTGDRTEIRDWLDRGFHLGITGWLCDERRGQALQDAVRYLPLDRLLLETDAPYLLPRDLPKSLQSAPTSRRNEPKFLPHIAEKLAILMNKSTTVVAEAAYENTVRLFKLPP